MIISRAPVRLSFFGGGTDYREYFERKGGAVLGATIDKYTYVSVNRLSNFFDYSIRVGYSKAELVNRVEDIVHPSVRETLKFMDIKGNLDVHIFADLPARTGLGSSSSFTVAFLNALYALEGKKISKGRLADEATRIEQELIGESVGCQDQTHCAFGGLNLIEFKKSGTSVRPVIITKEKYSLLNDSLLVFYTGLTRLADEIAKDKIEKIKSLDSDSYLNRMHEMAFEAEDIISAEEPNAMLEKLGKLLDEGWNLKKRLSGKVSNDKIDNAYRKAMDAGAYGGKLAGAGGGGFLFFLAPEDKKSAVRESLKDFLEVDFSFESEGAKIIYLSH